MMWVTENTEMKLYRCYSSDDITSLIYVTVRFSEDQSLLDACNCRPHCQETSYTVSVSSVKYPNRNFLQQENYTPGKWSSRGYSLGKSSLPCNFFINQLPQNGWNNFFIVFLVKKEVQGSCVQKIKGKKSIVVQLNHNALWFSCIVFNALWFNWTTILVFVCPSMVFNSNGSESSQLQV